jgi:hypothetical protein
VHLCQLHRKCHCWRSSTVATQASCFANVTAGALQRLVSEHLGPNIRLTVDTHDGHLCALMPVASQILLLAWFNSCYLGHLHRKCYYWRGSTARLSLVGIDSAHYFVISVHSTNLLFNSAGASSPALLHCHFLPLLPLPTSQSVQQSSCPLLDPSTINLHSNKAAPPSKYQPSCQEPLNSPVNEPFLFFLISFCKLHLDNLRCWKACVVWSFQRVCELSASLPVNEPRPSCSC